MLCALHACMLCGQMFCSWFDVFGSWYPNFFCVLQTKRFRISINWALNLSRRCFGTSWHCAWRWDFCTCAKQDEAESTWAAPDPFLIRQASKDMNYELGQVCITSEAFSVGVAIVSELLGPALTTLTILVKSHCPPPRFVKFRRWLSPFTEFTFALFCRARNDGLWHTRGYWSVPGCSLQ